MQKIKVLLGIIIITLSLLVPTSGSAAIFTPNVEARAALLVDFKTGQVIAEKNGSEKLPIASISKLIVVYMIEEMISEGKITLETPVKVSKELATFSQDSSVANTPLAEGREYSVADLINAAMLPSSNSTAMVLAEVVAGSQSKFYQKADQLISTWGITGVNLVTASGLPNGSLENLKNKSLPDDAENKLSARDVAIIAHHLVQKYPEILKVSSQKEVSFPGIRGHPIQLKSTMPIIGAATSYNFTGLKTGLTANDGTTFVGIATYQTRQVITVVLDTGKDSKYLQVFDQTKELLTQTDAQAKLTKYDTKTFNQSVTVKNAHPQNVKLVLQKPVYLFIPKNETVQPDTKNLIYSIPLIAPIDKDEIVARAELQFNSAGITDYLGKAPKLSFVSVQKVEEKPSIYEKIGDWIRNIFK
ncbi:MAG: serine hydrolase [Lactobacillaceae bacterium]|jgi:D-alanyl-D-alanine carboxypeptidase (penicillin-binding protein 5/6)|nr:serine hydrolase [Lactobacillaceae bacterium]